MRALALVPPFIRDASRTGLFVVAACLALVAYAAAAIIGPLSLGTGAKITRDIGLAALVIDASLLLFVGGIFLVAREIERRTIFLLVTRPVSRAGYLFGKFLGLTVTGWIVLGITAGVFATALVLRGETPDLAMGQALALAALEIVVLAAIATLFASLTQPIPAMFYALATFVAGHAMASLTALAADTVTGPSRALLNAFRWLFPDLSRFDMRLHAVQGITISAGELLSAAAYAIVYAAGVSALACAIFAKRELK